MAEEHAGYEMQLQEEQGPVLIRRPVEDTADLDITPMIDITFLLLIFFLVASVPDASTAVDLPPARYGKGVSDRSTVIITIAATGEGKSQVFLHDGTGDDPLADDPENPDVLDDQIIQYVQDEVMKGGKSGVLIKAGKQVLHRDVNRIAAAAGRIEGEGVPLYLAVFEVQ